MLQAEICDGCGQPRSESMAVGNDDAYTAKPMRCFGCRSKSRAAEGITDPAGMYYAVEKT